MSSFSFLFFVVAIRMDGGDASKDAWHFTNNYVVCLCKLTAIFYILFSLHFICSTYFMMRMCFGQFET